jgi:hypothetical protein
MRDRRSGGRTLRYAIYVEAIAVDFTVNQQVGARDLQLNTAKALPRSCPE